MVGTSKNLTIFGAVVFLALILTEIATAYVYCDFNLVYTLDDPYTHLAVADQILSGWYGVNAGEYSSPSSSIIWPYLLAITEAMGLGVSAPVLINGCAALASVLGVIRLLQRTGLVDRERDPAFSYGLVVLVMFVASAVALPMTGMEHSLHVWTVIVTFCGLVYASEGIAPTWGHFLALVLMPLVRFEGAAFALSAIVAYALLGQRRFAMGAALVTACLLAVYAIVMSSRGLPLIPRAFSY